jgi:hypothetical protein
MQPRRVVQGKGLETSSNQGSWVKLKSVFKRRSRLVLVSVVSFIAFVAVFSLTYYVIAPTTDPGAKATMIAAVLSLVGLAISAMYKEVSSYYQEISSKLDKKWNLVYPLLSKHYKPWINSADAFRHALEALDTPKKTFDDVVGVMYSNLVFYGYRQRFISEQGGMLLLLSSEDDQEVRKAYANVVIASNWGGNRTTSRRYASKLQKMFVTLDKPDSPFLLNDFFGQVAKDNEDPKLKDMVNVLSNWLTEENRTNLIAALTQFSQVFNQKVDALAKAWEA